MAFPHDGKKFQKGQSGNPKGGPKKIPAIDELLAEVLGDEQNGINAAKAILIALRNSAIKGNVRAAEVIIERAYGKAKQNIKLEGDLNINPFKWEEIEGNKED